VVWVINNGELTSRVQSHGHLPTRLNWASCQRVAQHVHLLIRIRLMNLQCVNSILSYSHLQQPTMCFCLLSSLQYLSIWYLCCTFDIWHCCLPRQSIIQLCSLKSARCLFYKIWKSCNYWCSGDAHFQDAAGSMSLLLLPVLAPNISSMDVRNQSEHNLFKMQS